MVLEEDEEEADFVSVAFVAAAVFVWPIFDALLLLIFLTASEQDEADKDRLSFVAAEA